MKRGPKVTCDLSEKFTGWGFQCTLPKKHKSKAHVATGGAGNVYVVWEGKELLYNYFKQEEEK